MRHAAAALLALASFDTSWTRETVDFSRFELVRSFGPRRSSILSPAGDHFALYTGNNVTLFDIRQEKEVRVLAGHAAQVHDSGWSREGRVLATSGYDGTVRLWEVSTGRELSRLEAHSGYA